MGETKIKWADYVFNPWRGCAHVDIGCEHCYAERWAKRQSAVFGTWGPRGNRISASAASWRGPLRWNKAAEKSGVRPRVFCGSMCDVFEDRLDLLDLRFNLRKLIDRTPSLDWLLLTKRPENADRLWEQVATDCGDPSLMVWPDNVWLGYSASTQDDLDRGLPYLLRCPAAVRFVSLEPLLGHICVSVGLHQIVPSDCLRVVIVGGESGPGARPCHIEWIRSVVQQCEEAGVPIFVTQLGRTIIATVREGSELGWKPAKRWWQTPCRDVDVPWRTKDPKGSDPSEWPEDLRRARQMPEVAR